MKTVAEGGLVKECSGHGSICMGKDKTHLVFDCQQNRGGESLGKLYP